jgi:hypothetical protein
MLLPGVKKHSDYASEYSAVLKKLHRLHQLLTVIYLPLVITCMGFSCYFAYIHGAAFSYTDPGEDWEACYIVNNALQVPLAPILTDIGTKVGEQQQQEEDLSVTVQLPFFSSLFSVLSCTQPLFTF